MKKLIFLFLVICSLKSYSQGELQFAGTQLLTLSGPLQLDGAADIQTIEIPEGQTWKIESANLNIKISSTGTSYIYDTNMKLLIGDVILWSYATNPRESFPLWLPAGSYTFTLWNDAVQPNGYIGHGMISAVAFNIVN